MKDVIEIRWHGRGGQGTVTAAKALAEAALVGGKYIQAFPDYGPERMGAPLRVYNRISPDEITIHCPVRKPNIVVVMDPSLIGAVDVLEGAKEDATVLVNTHHTPSDLKLDTGGRDLYTVDATKISLDCIGRVMPNTPIMGALVKVTGIVTLDTLVNHIETAFKKKFSAEILEGNVKAIKRAYEEVQGK
ncbi:2-oxoacid:acceptor oxidoreductase family protein [Thermodesulfobacteriota bacterium]